jgi:soluble lytic murein transglycosylase
MQQHFAVKLVLVLIPLLFTTAHAADDLAPLRERFLAARTALDARQLDDFHRISDQLRDYPLYPYLEYWYLRDRLVPANRSQIEAFIKRYADQPVGQLLRRSWLYKLASAKEWKSFLSLYDGDQPVTLQCYRQQAKLSGGSKDTAEALALWLVGRSQDSTCDPVFSQLEARGVITDDLRRQRIRLAMNEGNLTLATFLARRLPKADQDWVATWRDAYQRPASALDSGKLASDTPRNREIILHALHRLARADVEFAHDRWVDIRPRYRFDTSAAGELDKDIALIAGWRRLPDAHGWLSAVPETVADTEVREWRVRSAIAEGLWPSVLEHIDKMPPAEASREEWRYWRGVALANTAQKQPAQDQFSTLARERDYYGFLAADELRWPYVMDNRPIEIAPGELQAVQTQPGIVRAHELLLAGLQTEARREWATATEGLNKQQLKVAAHLASEWGWHERAIMTVARSADYDDLELRFPLDHVDNVKRYADEFHLDPGHVYAVIRTESAFNPDARSGAGALGLMQLMPATGRVTARKHSIPLPGTQHLFDPDSNIRIGSAYLKEVMNRYDNNVVLASAAYNAGPQRVQRWLPEDGSSPAASWVATIPFDETRKYVQRILAYAAIYDWRLQRPVITLSEHMPDIRAGDAYPDNSR